MPAATAGSVRGFSATGTYSSNSVVVGYKADVSAKAAVAGVPSVRSTTPRTAVARLRRGESPLQGARRIAKRPGVAWVRPNHLAQVSDNWVPNDPGRGKTRGGWQKLQWNFIGQYGINVLPAWQHLRDLKRAGAEGVTVAVIDTGVAYRNRGKFRRSPDLAGVRVRAPHDFVSRDKFPEDRNGHGTHVASTIFERTNNGVGVTGIAHRATMMPIRALNAKGLGDELTVARAVRYAAKRGARIINISAEFDVRLKASDLPAIVSAMRYANRKGALVVAAAGNQGVGQLAFPARSSYAVAVGATTINGCLADYSNHGRNLDLVAPGGGGDDTVGIDRTRGSTDPKNCRIINPEMPIYQMTFTSSVRRFGLPSRYQGTSMASPHVSATAALVIASRVIGAKSKPAALKQRLQETATDLGRPGYDTRYGHGLINAAAAIGVPEPEPEPAPAQQ